ncbi:HNH endonuclease [Streptomyces roseifaciens]
MPVSPYTREVLAEAAGSSRTLSEALEKLGVDPKSSRRTYLRERMRKLGVETSHFEREGVRWTKEILESAVAVSSNMCEVLRRPGLEVVGGHHTHISRRIRGFGIDVSHFPRRPYRRGRPCPDTLRNAVSRSVSVAETLRRLGRLDTTGQRSRLRQWIAEDGLTTSHFLGQAHQRGKPGPTPRKTPEEVLVKHSGKRRTRTVLLRRALNEVGVAHMSVPTAEPVPCGTASP